MRGHICYWFLSALLFLLYGCSSNAPVKEQKPYFTSNIVVVPGNEWGKYWQSNYHQVSFPEMNGLVVKDSGCVMIKFIIDSNGRVFDPVVVKVSGGKWYELYGMQMLGSLTFTPAPGNINRIPIETSDIWAAMRSKGKPDKSTMREISSRCRSS